FAEPPPRIGICPEFALRNILQTSDLRTDPQHLGRNASRWEGLISFFCSQLNSECGARRERVQSQIGKGCRGNDDVGIESVDRLDVTIDRQTADQTPGPERFASPDQTRK